MWGGKGAARGDNGMTDGGEGNVGTPPAIFPLPYCLCPPTGITCQIRDRSPGTALPDSDTDTDSDTDLNTLQRG